MNENKVIITKKIKPKVTKEMKKRIIIKSETPERIEMIKKEKIIIEPQVERFFNAIKNNDIERIKNIVESEVPIVDIQCINEALIIALKIYNWEIVKYLIEHGADVNIKNDNGKTALNWAEPYIGQNTIVRIGGKDITICKETIDEIIKILMEAGAK